LRRCRFSARYILVVERATRIAIQSANLVHELAAELSNPVRLGELVWRFRRDYQPQLAVLWRSASTIDGITERQFLPDSVEVVHVDGLESDSKQVYTMTELTADNTPTLIRDVIEKLRWLAQYSLAVRG
jgi:hypothetical protein